MSNADKPDTSLPPIPPKILQNLRWLQLNWRRHWGLLLVAALIAGAPAIWTTLQQDRVPVEPPAPSDSGSVPADESDLHPAATPAVPAWLSTTLADLDHPDSERQLAAVRQLSEYSHPAARTALEKAISHPNEDVRCLAVLKLGKIADPASLPVLIDALEEGAFPYPGYLLWAIQAFTPSSAIDAVVRPYLKHEQPAARAAALRVLAKAGHSSDIPMFLKLLENGSPMDCGEAIRALKMFGSRALYPTLCGGPQKLDNVLSSGSQPKRSFS